MASYFAKKLKELRLKAHWTQQDVGEKVGLSRACVANYESGKREPNHRIVLEFAHLFDCTVDDLLNPEATRVSGAAETFPSSAKTAGDYIDISHLSAPNQAKVRELIRALEAEEMAGR